MERGEQVSFELSSADASTAAAVVVYDLEGRARTVGAKERLVIDSVQVASAVAVVGDFYGGSGASAGAGERIVSFATTTSNGMLSADFETPRYVKTGITPKVKAAAAGQFTLTGTGFILKA